MVATRARVVGQELWDILKIAQASKSTLKLAIESTNGVGSICFNRGSVVQATAAEQTGNAAIEVLLKWREATVTAVQLPADLLAKGPKPQSGPQQKRVKSDRAQAAPRTPQTTQAPQQSSPVREQRRSASPPRQPPPAAEFPPVPVENREKAVKAAPPEKPKAGGTAAILEIFEEVGNALSGGMRAIDLMHKQDGLSLIDIGSSDELREFFSSAVDLIVANLPPSNPQVGEVKNVIIEGDEAQLIFAVDIDEDYRCFLLLDGQQVQVAYLLGIVIPDIVPKIAAALGGG